MAEDLTANGEKEVFFELNGQLRSVFIKDKEAVKVCSNPRLQLDFSASEHIFGHTSSCQTCHRIWVCQASYHCHQHNDQTSINLCSFKTHILR